jgi:hypothetical protein
MATSKEEFERQVELELARLRAEIGAAPRDTPGDRDSYYPLPPTSRVRDEPFKQPAPRFTARAPSPLAYQADFQQPEPTHRRREFEDASPLRRGTPPRQYSVGDGPQLRFVPDSVRDATAAAWVAAAEQPRGRLPRKRRDDDIGPDPYGGRHRGASAGAGVLGSGGGSAGDFFLGGVNGSQKAGPDEQARYALELDRQVEEARQRKQSEKARRDDEDARLLQSIQQQQPQQRRRSLQPSLLAPADPPSMARATSPFYRAASPTNLLARATSPLPGARQGGSNRVEFAGNMDAATLHQRVMEGQTFSRCV